MRILFSYRDAITVRTYDLQCYVLIIDIDIRPFHTTTLAKGP